MLNLENIPGLVCWPINDKCNYRCSCFTQPQNNKWSTPVKNCATLIKQFKKCVPKGWNFYIFGTGEPFLHPDICKITTSLVGAGYTISTMTNLSTTRKELDNFFRAAKDKCLWFTASLHLEHTSFKSFFSKIKYINKKYIDLSKIEIATVLVPSKLDEIKKYAAETRNYGLEMRLQPMISGKSSHYRYAPAEIKKIKTINANFYSESKEFKKQVNTGGQKCFCGFKYFIINPYGFGYRCSQAMQNNNTMGNIINGDFSPYKRPRICQEGYCRCGERYNTIFKQYNK